VANQVKLFIGLIAPLPVCISLVQTTADEIRRVLLGNS
jgi:hypothetical protein